MHLVFILFDTTLHVRQTKLCNILLHIIVIVTKLHFMICCSKSGAADRQIANSKWILFYKCTCPKRFVFAVVEIRHFCSFLIILWYHLVTVSVLLCQSDAGHRI